MQGTNPSCQKGSTLTSDTCEEPIQHACSKSRALTFDQVGTNPTVTSDMEGTKSSHHDRMAHPLHLTMEGT